MDVKRTDNDDTVRVTIYMDEIIKIPTFEVHNIYYDYNKDELRPSSVASLDTLVNFMNDNPSLSVEIYSFADAHGNPQYNRDLSLRRAESVMSYLETAGIERSRMTAKGFGESMPAAANKNPDGSDNPAGRQLNRRTELRIISDDGTRRVLFDSSKPGNMSSQSQNLEMSEDMGDNDTDDGMDYGDPEESDYLEAFVPVTDWNETELETIAKQYNVSYTTQEVKNENWNAKWESSFEPVIVDGFCAIRADFHEPVDGVQHEIVITPKMSFGTGHHATTQLMIQHMSTIDFKQKEVLDFGTGTKNSGDMLNIRTLSTGSRGWAVFDLSTIPAGAIITSAQVKFRTFSTTNSGATNRIRGVSGNPVTMGGTTLFNLLNTGTVLNASSWPANAANTETVTSAGLTYLENNIGGDILLGFVRGSTNQYNIYGNTASAANVPKLEITYLTLCTGAPTAGNINSPTNVCPNKSFTVALSGHTVASGVTYQWQSKPSGSGVFTNIAGATNTSYNASINTATDFRCIVTCGNSSQSATTSPVSISVNSFYVCYCNDNLGGNNNVPINNVTIT
ncbi:predicted protein, partial [Nematostella vectensis]